MNKFLILVLSIAFVASVNSQVQFATLYESRDCFGPFVTISNDYNSDLSTVGFNNRARSVRLVGTWMFYDNRNFNLGADALMEWIFRPLSTCVNFQSIGGLISSIKFAGAPNDYRQSYITFYEGIYFQGTEEFTADNISNLRLNGRIKSLIVTGSSSWTLYDRVNYGGNSVCISPPSSNNFLPALIENTESIRVPHNTIASVRRGCFGVRTATFDSAQEGKLVI